MPLDSDLFTSFQLALGALEQLAIINHTNTANATTGNIETVHVDLKLHILRLSNLETCLALSQSCSTYRKLWESLDKTLVREKVQKRVPWFEINEGSTGLTNWDQCARVLVSRTKKALSEKEDLVEREGRILMKSVEMTTCANVTVPIRVDSVDVTFDPELRMNMKPMFPDANLQTLIKQDIKGTNLRQKKISLDLKTLKATTGTSEPWQDDEPQIKERNNRVSAPSGIELRHSDPKGFVCVVKENDHLLHIKYSTDRPWVGVDDKGHKKNKRADIDGVVHKDSHEHDEDGCLIIDPASLIIQQAEKDVAQPLINLLPGNAGALIARFTDHILVSPYLGYIEPTPELTHVIICAVPYPGYGGFMSFESSSQQFCVTYNGYLYYLHEGRFTQMWVDLGVRKRLKLRSHVRKYLGHHTLVQKYETRALTCANVFFPMIGTFAIQIDIFGYHGIVQGDKNQGLDRFVTLQRAYRCVVGDLLTGRTYFCKNPKMSRQFSIPYIDNKKKKTVGFYSFSPYVTAQLTMNLMDMERTGRKTADYNLKYETEYMDSARRELVAIAHNYMPDEDFEEFADNDPDKKHFYQYPRRIVTGELAFGDRYEEFTNIDGDHEELQLQSDKETDYEDWDCGHDLARCSSEYEMDSDEGEFDSDSKLTVAQLNKKYKGKVPSAYYRQGVLDGKRGRPDTTYHLKMDYYKGYHAAHRMRFGFTDPKDKDDYWGSNPHHGEWYL